MQEKKLQKNHENFVNEVYMQKWMQMAEDDNARRRQEEEIGKKKRLDVKEFLIMQMQGNSLTTSISAQEPLLTESAKKTVGKAMNVEELRLNK